MALWNPFSDGDNRYVTEMRERITLKPFLAVKGTYVLHNRKLCFLQNNLMQAC